MSVASLIVIAAISTGSLISEGRLVGEVAGDDCGRQLPLGASVEVLLRDVVFSPDGFKIAGEMAVLVDGQVDLPWQPMHDSQLVFGDLVMYTPVYIFDPHVGSDGWQAMSWRCSSIPFTPEYTVQPAGDANLDGSFDTADLLQIFQAGEYEDGVAQNSTWSTGDWNADREFDSSDLVVAHQEGSYVAAATAVPEPNAVMLLLLGAAICVRATRSVSHA